MEYKVAQLQSQNKELLDQIENLSDSAKKVKDVNKQLQFQIDEIMD